MITPDYLLYYWSGSNPIPPWRWDCFKRLYTLYPEAEIIENTSIDFSFYHCDTWRLQKCSELTRCLWVDNDIWLDGPLDLCEDAAVADEYGCGHISICWSGDHPRHFKDLILEKNYDFNTLQDRVRRGKIDKIKIRGTHWAMTESGEKVNR